MEKPLEQLLNQGTLGSLLVLALLALAFLYRDMQKKQRLHDKALAETAKASEDVTKQRLEDTKTLIVALEQNSRANIALERSSQERAAAVQELTRGFASMAAQIVGGHDRMFDYLQKFEQRMEAIDRNVDKILDRSGAKS